MNVLKLFLYAAWGKPDDRVPLSRFQKALGRRSAAKNAKDFHASDDFLSTVVINVCSSAVYAWLFMRQLLGFQDLAVKE